MLTLRVSPIDRHQRLTLVPVSIRYSTQPGQWETYKSGIEYSDVKLFLDELEEARVGDRSFPSLFERDGVSLWHFIPAYVLPELYRIIELVKAVREIVEITKPEGIRVIPGHDHAAHLWLGAVKAVSDAEGIPLEIGNADGDAPRSPRSYRSSIRDRWVGRSVRLLLDLVFDVSSAIVARKNRTLAHPESGKTLLFGTYPRLWTQEPLGDGKFDEQLSPLIDPLLKGGWTRIVGVDMNYASARREALRVLRSRLRTEPRVAWRPFYSYRGVFDHRLSRRGFLNQWMELSKDEGFRHAFVWGGVDLWPAISPVLQRTFEHLLPDILRMLRTASSLVEQERPDAVMVSYETGPLQRALIVQAARVGIPSIGLQHGIVFENNYEHMHRRVTTRPDVVLDAYPVPTVTCAWGREFRRVYCSKGHYPEKAVEVTGHWRYDPMLQRVLGQDREDIKRRFGWDESKRLILILSSDQDSPTYVRECLRAIRDRNDVQVLVKPHPSEAHDPIRTVLREEGLDPRALLKEHLVEALISADVVVSQPSTVLGEAILLDRPTVLVDLQHTDRSRPSGWEALHMSGAFVYVTDPSGLRSALESVLADGEVRDVLRKRGAILIRELFGPLDGRSAERVIDVLDRLTRTPDDPGLGPPSRQQEPTIK